MGILRKAISWVAMSGLICLVGCAGVEGGKGAESPMPVDGSADSWQSPTYHGPLLIGSENQGEFKDNVFFHAWTFVLEGPADISIWVNPSADNLDTVMYLYRRDPGQTNWGRYIARNDDHDDNLWSRLDESLDAGEYRVMLKGYKQSIRGRFALVAECAGSGCPTGSDCGDDIASPSRDTGPAPSCVNKTMDVLTSKVISTGRSWVAEDDRCNLPEIARLGWEYYYSYFDGYVGIEDHVYGDEIEFQVEYSELEKGWLVGVDIDGDEDFMHYLFDDRGNLLVFYQSNQSPDVGWFCGDADEEVDPELWPGEFCVGHYLRNMQAPEDPAQASGNVLVQTSNEMLPNLGHQAVLKYQEMVELQDSDSVDYSYSQWPGADDGNLMEITLSAEDKPEFTYTMGGGDYSVDMYFYVGPDGAVFDCQELN